MAGRSNSDADRRQAQPTPGREGAVELMYRVVLGVGLLAALAAQIPDAVRFVDIALEAGLKDVFYCGGERTKNYIIETLGTGAAFLDYDNDGDLDIFIVNANKLEGFPAGEDPTNHL